MFSNNPHIFVSLKFYYLHLFDKLLTRYCSSTFLICIVLGLIKIIKSGSSIHRCFEIIKKTLKPVHLAFFCDLSAENPSRIEVAKYLTFLSPNWKFYLKHFLIKNYVVDMHWWVPSWIIYWVLAPILLLLKCFSWWNLFCVSCSSCGMFY